MKSRTRKLATNRAAPVNREPLIARVQLANRFIEGLFFKGPQGLKPASPFASGGMA
jgi:hypothetical protein